MTPEIPAMGILKSSDFGDAKFYYVECECGNKDCSHNLEIEADDIHIQVHICTTVHTKWWERARWKQLWEICTNGYTEMETTIVLREQAALNYATALLSSIDDVKKFKGMK